MIIVSKAAPGVSTPALQRFLRTARKIVGLRGDVNVVLASSRDLRALNRRFRGKDRPTDVLSFPPAPAVWPGTSARERGAKPRPTSADSFSGDIVISADIAARNARLCHHDAAQELKILILHGLLHLAGYDHESDHGEMARQEERLRRELGLTDGLIRRAHRVTHAPSPVGHAPSRVRVGARSASSATRAGKKSRVDGQPSTLSPRSRAR